jgi:hypothetical protein
MSLGELGILQIYSANLESFTDKPRDEMAANESSCAANESVLHYILQLDVSVCRGKRLTVVHGKHAA